MKKLTCIIIVLNLGAANIATSKEAEQMHQKYIYTVKQGDELGSLMYSMGFTPVWGDLGMVQNVVNINKLKTQKNGDLIIPGDTLILPAPPLLFSCNVSIQNKEVSILKRVKTKKQYKELLSTLIPIAFRFSSAHHPKVIG